MYSLVMVVAVDAMGVGQVVGFPFPQRLTLLIPPQAVPLD